MLIDKVHIHKGSLRELDTEIQFSFNNSWRCMMVVYPNDTAENVAHRMIGLAQTILSKDRSHNNQDLITSLEWAEQRLRSTLPASYYPGHPEHVGYDQLIQTLRRVGKEVK